jgi:hypothetical protein
MAPKFSRSAEFPAALSRAMARALILLLVVFHPSLWIPDAIAQQADKGDAAAKPEPTPAAEGKSLLSIRRPIWSENSSALIVAFLQNQPATTTTPQPQPPKTPAPPTAQKKSNKLMWILIGAAGGGAVAAFALKGKGGSDSSTPQTPLTTVTAGPPTVGPPQ